MKKYLLFIISMLCVSIGAWAESIGTTSSTYTYDSTNKKLTLNLEAANDLSNSGWFADNGWGTNAPEDIKSAECVVIKGKLGETDASKLWQFSSAFLYDLSSADVSAVGNNKLDLSNPSGALSVVVPSTMTQSQFASWAASSYKWGSGVLFEKNGTELNMYAYGNSNPKIIETMQGDKNKYHVFDDMTVLNVYNSEGKGVTINTDIVNAINQANRDIETINMEDAHASNLSINIANTHITTLNLSGLTLEGNNVTLTIGGGAKSDMLLQTLNLTDIKVEGVDASDLNKLEAINLSGANITSINITQTDDDYSDYSNLKITVDDPDLASKITPAPTTIWGDDMSSHITVPSNDPVEVTVASPLNDTTVQAAIDALGAAKPEGATPKNVQVIHVTGELTKSDIQYLQNLGKLKLADLSGCTLASDVTYADVASITKDQYNIVKSPAIAIIVPTPASTDVLKGQVEMYGYQQSGAPVIAYYTDKANKKLNVWTDGTANSAAVANLKAVVDNTTALTFLPIYKEGGDFNDSGYNAGYSNTIIDGLGELPAASMDFTWVNHGTLKYDFTSLNPATHYIIIPQQCANYDANSDMTNDTGDDAAYKYGENIWVVSTYKGKASPYATGSSFNGHYMNTAPKSGSNLTGVGENGTTAMITYLRKPGVLNGASNYVSDIQKNAERLVIVGQLGTTTEYGSDITALNYMQCTTVNLSDATFAEGTSLDTYSNSYVQCLALPYNSAYDVASFKASKCTGLKGVGKFDKTTKHLYLQSYEAGNMTEIASCLYDVTGIEYLTAAGPMNAVDLGCGSHAAHDNRGHFIGYETANNTVGKDMNIDESNGYKINGASYNAAWNGKKATPFKGIDITGVTLPSEEANSSSKAVRYADGTYQDDLHMGNLGWVDATQYIKLPIDKSVWRISTGFANNGVLKINSICIPGNYKEIGSNAFEHDNNLLNLYTTTTDANGNGTTNYIYYDKLSSDPHSGAPDATVQSLTFPSSLTKIEAGAFGNVEHFADVYVTSKTVPVCEKDAFGAGTYYGWGGFNDRHDGTACRDDYGEQAGETVKCYGVLHWTEKFSLADVKKFTDINRVYSLRDNGKTRVNGQDASSGDPNTDDRGNVLMWPTQAEINRAYALASNGYLDGAWKKLDYNTATGETVLDGEGNPTTAIFSPGTATTKEDADKYFADNSSPSDQTYTDYIGWHQFALVGSWSYAEKYEMRPWNTINIPYDVTFDQLKKFFGVTKSVSANNKKIIVNSEGYPIKNSGLAGVDATTGEVATNAEDLLPTLSTLTHVKQEIKYTEGSATDGMVTLMFSEDLAEKSKNGTVYNWSISADKPEGQPYSGNYVVNNDNKIMLADYPYHIKPFVPLGAGDIRVYINNELKSAGVTASTANAPAEWKVNAILSETGKEGAKTNEVQAFKYQFKGNYKPITYNGKEMNCEYVPKYSYFLWVPVTGESLWYRYEPSWGDWKSPLPQYSAIIFKDNGNGDPAYDLLVTEEGSLAPRFGIAFGGDIDDETTGISELNNESRTNVMNGRVYNMRGEVVSESGSTAGLAKGIYIINGKKVAIK